APEALDHHHLRLANDLEGAGENEHRAQRDENQNNDAERHGDSEWTRDDCMARSKALQRQETTGRPRDSRIAITLISARSNFALTDVPDSCYPRSGFSVNDFEEKRLWRPGRRSRVAKQAGAVRREA